MTESDPEAASERGNWWDEISAGARHLAATDLLGRLTVLLAVAFGATGLANVAVFPVMEQGLGVPAETLGLLVSVQGVGAVVAGITAASAIGRWGEAHVFAIGLLSLAVGLGALIVALLPVVLVGLTLIGAGVTWTVVGFVTMRQRLTPPRLQGRSAAAANMAINIPQMVITLIGAAVVTLVDYRLLLLATSIVVLGAAVATPRRTPAAPSTTAHDTITSEQLEPADCG